jgi:hypothetical protein
MLSFVFSQVPVIFLLYLQVGLTIMLLHNLLLCHAVLMTGLILLILLSLSVDLLPVFPIDGHLETSDKAISCGIFLFLKPFRANI